MIEEMRLMGRKEVNICELMKRWELEGGGWEKSTVNIDVMTVWASTSMNSYSFF